MFFLNDMGFAGAMAKGADFAVLANMWCSSLCQQTSLMRMVAVATTCTGTRKKKRRKRESSICCRHGAPSGHVLTMRRGAFGVDADPQFSVALANDVKYMGSVQNEDKNKNKNNNDNDNESKSRNENKNKNENENNTL